MGTIDYQICNRWSYVLRVYLGNTPLLLDPIDAVESMLWLAPSKVTILEGDNPMYTYKIFNEDQNRAVNAKLASE